MQLFWWYNVTMKTLTEKPKRVTFRLSEELFALLESISTEQKRTVNAQVELYVEASLKAYQAEQKRRAKG